MASIPKMIDICEEFEKLNDTQKIYIMGAMAALTVNKEMQPPESEDTRQKPDDKKSAS